MSTRPCYSWVALGQESSISTALLPPPKRTRHRTVGQDRPDFPNNYSQRPSMFKKASTSLEFRKIPL